MISLGYASGDHVWNTSGQTLSFFFKTLSGLMDSPYITCVDICRYRKNHFRDVLTNIFYHGDVLTIFWDVLTNSGTFWLCGVLTWGRFDCSIENGEELCRGYKSKISRKLNDNYTFSYTTTNFPRLLDHASFIRSADNALLTQKIANERMSHVFSRL